MSALLFQDFPEPTVAQPRQRWVPCRKRIGKLRGGTSECDLPKEKGRPPIFSATSSCYVVFEIDCCLVPCSI